MENLPSSFTKPSVEQQRAFRKAESEVYVDWGPALPEHYGRDCIAAMVRDPRMIYFYWELKGPRKDAFLAYDKGAFDDARLVMEVVDLDTGDTETLDVSGDLGNWYYPATPATGYKARIGYLRKNGKIMLFAESNAVRTPPEGPSFARGKPGETADFAEELEAALFSAGGSWLGVSSPARFRFFSSRRNT